MTALDISTARRCRSPWPLPLALAAAARPGRCRSPWPLPLWEDFELLAREAVRLRAEVGGELRR